jgi:integrase/recombinase XerC
MLTARSRNSSATARPDDRGRLRRGWHVASLEKLREEFLKAKEFSTRRGEPASPETIKSYKTALRSFEIHVAGATAHDYATSFTGAMVTEWFVKLTRRGLSRKALASVYQPAIREFAKWGLKRGYWRTDPTADLQVIRAPRGLPRPFSPEERNALMALPLGPKEAALRGVLYYLGLRDATICRLRLGDLDNPERLEDGRVKPATMWTLGKGNKEGAKPLHVDLWALLLAYDETRAPDDKRRECFLFANADGTPWRPKTIQRRVRAWGVAAGVTPCTPHKWRHTAATDLLTRSGNIRAVQKFLGHASLATTQIYTEVVDQILADAIAMLPSFGPVTPGPDSTTGLISAPSDSSTNAAKPAE